MPKYIFSCANDAELVVKACPLERYEIPFKTQSFRIKRSKSSLHFIIKVFSFLIKPFDSAEINCFFTSLKGQIKNLARQNYSQRFALDGTKKLAGLGSSLSSVPAESAKAKSKKKNPLYSISRCQVVRESVMPCAIIQINPRALCLYLARSSACSPSTLPAHTLAPGLCQTKHLGKKSIIQTL